MISDHGLRILEGKELHRLPGGMGNRVGSYQRVLRDVLPVTMHARDTCATCTLPFSRQALLFCEHSRY